MSALLLTAAPGSFGQQPPPPAPPDAPEEEPPVRLSVELVQVDVVVTDDDGRVVTDLGPDDFEVSENGRTQAITNFSVVRAPAAGAAPTAANPSPFAPEAPRREAVRRTMALVVDDLNLAFEDYVVVRKALARFVDEDMQPTDLVAILRTSGGGQTQQFTNDKRYLRAAISRVRFGPVGAQQGSIQRVRVTDRRGGGTSPTRELVEEDDPAAYYSTQSTLAGLRYIIGGMSSLPGRKSLVLLSRGVDLSGPTGTGKPDQLYTGKSGRLPDSGLHEAARRLIDMATRSSVVLYSVQATGLQTFVPGADVGDVNAAGYSASLRNTDARAKSGLSYIARETGGFFVGNTNDIHAAVARVSRDQEDYYLIGYVPEASSFEERAGTVRYNDLSVRVKRPGVKVRTRGGYYGVETKPEPTDKALPNKLFDALNSPFAASKVRLELTPLVYSDEKNGGYVKALLHIEASDLTLAPVENGRRKASFDLLAAVYDAAGGLVAWQAERYDMSTPADITTEALSSGLNYTMAVKVKNPGGYQVRAVVHDVTTNDIGSATQYVEVPKREKRGMSLSSVVVSGGAPGGSTSVDPAIRRFHHGDALNYELFVYNARQADGTQAGSSMKMRLVDETGRTVFEGQPRTVAPAQGEDRTRVATGGSLALGSELPAGEYALQVTVTDPGAKKEMDRVRVQWAFFTVE